MKKSIPAFLLGCATATVCLTAIFYFAIGHDLVQSYACSAALNGDLRGLRIAHTLGARLDREGTEGTSSPLLGAAWNGHTDIIRYVLGQGISLETKDNLNGTALARAASMGHVRTVEYLLKMGADVNVQDAEGGNTPIDLCRMYADQVGSEQTRTNAAQVEAMIALHGGKARTTQ